MIAKSAARRNVQKSLHFDADRQPPRRWVLLITVLVLAACSLPAYPQPKPKTSSTAAPLAKAASTPKKLVDQAVPDFRLMGTDGRPHTLRQYQGRPVALFFFCGCPWCHRCASLWGQFQRGGAVGPPEQNVNRPQRHPATPANAALPISALPITLIVFSGDSSSASAFAAQAGLDAKQTVLLPDPDMRVITLYQVDPCPRAFVLDSQDRLQYTNNHKDDAPQAAPEIVIASRALGILRNCAASSQPE